MCALREMQFCNTNVLLVTLCLSSISLREPRGGKIFQGLDFQSVLLTTDQKSRDFFFTIGFVDDMQIYHVFQQESVDHFLNVAA